VQGSFDQAKDNLLTDALAPVCLDYRSDVKSWLGSELAVAVLPGPARPEPVVMIGVKDEAKARRALDIASRRPCLPLSSTTSAQARTITYRIANGFALISSGSSGSSGLSGSSGSATDAIAAVAREAATHDGGLAKTSRFKAAVDQLHGDRMAFGWVDVGAVSRLAQGSVRGFKLPAGCGVVGQGVTDSTAAFSFFATPNTLALEAVTLGDRSASRAGPPSLTAGLPADSSAALTIFDLGGFLSRTLNCLGASGGGSSGLLKGFTSQSGIDPEADVLSWMHGEAVVVVGPSQGGGKLPGFALVVAPSDQAKAAAGLVKIRGALNDRGLAMVPRVVGGSPAYVSDRQAGSGIQPAMALIQGRFLLASSPDYLASLIAHKGDFGTTDDYRSVIGNTSSGGGTVQVVVRMAPIRDAAAGNLHAGAGDRYRRDVAPYLEPLKAIGLRTWRSGTTGHVQVTIAFN